MADAEGIVERGCEFSIIWGDELLERRADSPGGLLVCPGDLLLRLFTEGGFPYRPPPWQGVEKLCNVVTK